MKKILLAAIFFYQKHISRLKPPCCRFYPTCSAYAVEAIQRFGPWKGGLLSIWRILRCNPFCLGGLDPVPETFVFPPWNSAAKKFRKSPRRKDPPC